MGLPPAQMAVAIRTTGTLGKTHRLAAVDVALLVEFDAGDRVSRVQTASLRTLFSYHICLSIVIHDRRFFNAWGWMLL